MASRNVIFIGPCGGGDVPKNGASAKNYHLKRHLDEQGFDVTAIDTENWKKNPFVLIRLAITIIFNPHAKYILSANSISSYRIIKFFSVLPHKRSLIYWVIGGCVADWIKDGKVSKEPYSVVETFIVEGRKMQCTLAAVGFSNVLHVPNFKRIEYIPVRSTCGNAAFRFVFLSRLIPQKGCDIIIDAVKMLNETVGSKFYVDFFGPFDKSYENVFIHKTSSIPNISYKGFLDLSKSENYDVLSSYDVMLFPTYWQGEGFPGIVIDAFIAGLPVIASDWNFNADIVEHGKTGIILSDNSPQCLHDAMLSCINGQVDLETMSANCRRMVSQYDIHNVVSAELLKAIGIS